VNGLAETLRLHVFMNVTGTGSHSTHTTLGRGIPRQVPGVLVL
jgi:hypothetical protein